MVLILSHYFLDSFVVSICNAFVVEKMQIMAPSPSLQAPFERVKDIYSQNPEFCAGPPRSGSDGARLGGRLSSLSSTMPRLSTMESLKLRSMSSNRYEPPLGAVPLSLSRLTFNTQDSQSPVT
jgi:hypothetical protein